MHVCVKAGWERGAPVQGSHAASLSAHCSVSVSMATGAAAPFWALAWLSGAARPPWELPALRPPAAHRPCQAGRKKACLLTPSTRLPGLRGSAQKMSGRGHWEVGLEPDCLQPRENAPWPAAALACQRPGEGSRPHGRAAGTQRGPSKALSEVSYPAYSAFSETPDHSWLGCPLLPTSFAEGFPSPRLFCF